MSPTGAVGSAVTASRTPQEPLARTPRTVPRRTGRCVGERRRRCPAGAPSSSNRSASVSCRSNFATCAVDVEPLDRQSGQFEVVRLERSGTSSITWNSGCARCDRAGSSTSTSRSNGTSACANAARSASRDLREQLGERAAPGRPAVRSTRVLTNMPTRSSSARLAAAGDRGADRRCRRCRDSRASSTASAACTTMNSGRVVLAGELGRARGAGPASIVERRRVPPR